MMETDVPSMIFVIAMEVVLECGFQMETHVVLVINVF